jgi:chemotaxis methyl-accepting protein methylase
MDSLPPHAGHQEESNAPLEVNDRWTSEAAGPFRHVVFLGDSQQATTAPRAAASPAARTASRAPPALDAESSSFFQALCARGGVAHASYRESIFERRKAACFRTLRVDTASAAAKAIGADEASAQRALGAVIIGVTEFFRDPQVFASLRGMLGALAASRGGAVDVLSVGCSDGSELYSVAMLLGTEGLLGGARLWGVDCRAGAIERARAGVFGARMAAGIPDELRGRYLAGASAQAGEACGGDVRISEPIRSACRWVVADAFAIASPADGHGIPAQVDLLLCRNLAIYLNAAAAGRLWELLAARLRPGGLLVVGKAERPMGTGDTRELLRAGPCIYRKAGENS